jgi:hypothetical protein
MSQNITHTNSSSTCASLLLPVPLPAASGRASSGSSITSTRTYVDSSLRRVNDPTLAVSSRIPPTVPSSDSLLPGCVSVRPLARVVLVGLLAPAAAADAVLYSGSVVVRSESSVCKVESE